MRITAIVEQAQEGAWSACTPGVMVYGASTREEALQGVLDGVAGLLAYIHAQGWQFLESCGEFVSLEV